MLTDQVFIGCRFTNVVSNTSAVQICTPIIMPKGGMLGKFIQHAELDYSNGLNDITNQCIKYECSDDFRHELCKKRQEYTVYLPYLKQLINVGKLNIYDLIYSVMTLIDEEYVYLSEMFENAICSHTTLQCSKNNSKKGLRQDCQTHQNKILRRLMLFIQAKKNLEKNPEDHNYKTEYATHQQQINEYFIQYPLLKELVQDLEYRYQGIIEPILLIDEISVYNYANGAEPPMTERITRASQVFEEGMKKFNI